MEVKMFKDTILNRFKSEKSRNIIFWVVVILSIMLFSIAISPKVLQNDTYYTIKIGEYISQNGISNLTQDKFSWHELPYTYPHWLYDLLMYKLYSIAGWDGIYYSTIILTALLGLSIYISSSKFVKNKLIAFVTTIGTMYLVAPYIAARAQLVTFVLFSLTVFFIEMFLRTHKKRYAIPLILIPIIITNMHCAVFPFYFILFLPYIAEWILVSLVDLDLDYRTILITLKLIQKFPLKQGKKDKLKQKCEKIPEIIEKKKANRAKRRENPYKIKVEKNPCVEWLFLIMIIAVFTGFLNPTGLGAYTYTYKIYQGNTTDSINEHLPVTLIESKEFLIALCFFLAILILTDTKIKLSDLFMLLGLTALALMSRRQISMFGIFCCPILVRLVDDLFEKYDPETSKKLFNFSTTITGSLILILLFAVVMTDKLKDLSKQEYIDKSTYPIEASNWILENLDLENLKLYNEYNYGSYLLFRGIPVFIDSRCDLYTPEFNSDKKHDLAGRDIFSDALDIAGIAVDYDRKFEEYGVNYIIAYSNSKLVMIMKDNKSYKSVYEDNYFSIFERKIK